MSEEWGWMEPDKAQGHGPFDTREEALEDAKGYDVKEILVGRYEWIDPCEYLPDDIESLLETIDDAASGDLSVDDSIVEVQEIEGADAQAELREALRAWGKRWLVATSMVLQEEGCEKVTIGK